MNEEYTQEVLSFLEIYFSNQGKLLSEETILKDLKITHKSVKPLFIKGLVLLAQNPKANFTFLGNDEKGKGRFVDRPTFIKLLKNTFLGYSTLLNENETFQAFQQLTQSKTVDLELIKSLVLRYTPLIRFFDNDRGGTAALNLYKFFYPDRDVFVSNQLTQRLNLKKMLFEDGEKQKGFKAKKEQATQVPSLLIQTAFSIVFSEIGRLIIPVKELSELKIYRNFFEVENPNDFFEKDLQTVFSHHPTIKNGVLNLFPENWLDLEIAWGEIRKMDTTEEQIRNWISERYPFLNTSEIATVYNSAIQGTAKESKVARASQKEEPTFTQNSPITNLPTVEVLDFLPDEKRKEEKPTVNVSVSTISNQELIIPLEHIQKPVEPIELQQFVIEEKAASSDIDPNLLPKIEIIADQEKEPLLITQKESTSSALSSEIDFSDLFIPDNIEEKIKEENLLAEKEKKESQRAIEEKEQSEEKQIFFHDLKGKIVSILTESEEIRLKIEGLAKTVGFETRDSLAYLPDLAVFDKDFEYLVPIAKNTGVRILMLKDFMKLLGFH